MENLPRRHKYVYVANGGNLGDFVITSSENDVMDKGKIDRVQLNRFNIHKSTSVYFNLIYGGGGAFVRYYINSPWMYHMREAFYNRNLKSAIVLPSTFYGVDNLIRLFDDRFAVMCRDVYSYEYCRSINYRANFLIHDDSAFKLDISKYDYSKVDDLIYGGIKTARDEILKCINRYKSKDIGYMMREDAEKINLKNHSLNFDISSKFRMMGVDLPVWVAREGTRLMLYSINQFDKIVTNRLHVSICAALLGKEVYLYDNSYGKNKRIYEFSMKNRFSNVHFMG